MSGKIVKFPGVAGDIVAGLRKTADQIEAGEFPELRFAVALLVDTDCGYTSFSWGPASMLEVIGALARAINQDLVDGG